MELSAELYNTVIYSVVICWPFVSCCLSLLSLRLVQVVVGGRRSNVVGGRRSSVVVGRRSSVCLSSSVVVVDGVLGGAC